MSYTLTLTKAERDAIDWIGYRYDNGHVLYQLLFCESTVWGERDWDDDGDMTFSVPEHVAWSILEIRDSNDGQWPCFTLSFAMKLNDFCDRIV